MAVENKKYEQKVKSLQETIKRNENVIQMLKKQMSEIRVEAEVNCALQTLTSFDIFSSFIAWYFALCLLESIFLTKKKKRYNN